MTKDEALKMAIDDAITKFINDVSDDNDSDSTWQSYAVQAAEMIRIRIQNACKEALAQPLTRDWKETIDERIAKDDEFKRALEQPSVAELNDEYLRDIYVQGLSQPAQEPVAWIYEWEDEKAVKLTFHPDSKAKVIPLYTHSAPLWQGLSDDEILEIDKSIDPEIIIGKGKTLFARAIEQALKDKNT